MKPNRQIMEKADMTVADLMTDGGYLNPEEFRRFLVNVIKESEVLQRIDAGPIRSHTQNMASIGLNGRVLRPGTSGQALPAADRAKPVTGNVELGTKYMKGEIWLDDETLEDNIEGGTLRTTVRAMMAEQIALDMDDLCVNGDTTSTDPFLAQFDGMLASATSNTVNAGVTPITKTWLKAALKAMPPQYNRNRRRQEFWTSDLALIDYRDYVSDRATALGDETLQREVRIFYQNRPVDDISVFPDNLGVGTNCTNILLLDPQTAKWGVWRQVRIATERSERAGLWFLIATVRAGFAYKEENSVVKVYNVQTS